MKIIFSKLPTSRIQAATIRIALHIGHRFNNNFTFLLSIIRVLQNFDEKAKELLFLWKGHAAKTIPKEDGKKR